MNNMNQGTGQAYLFAYMSSFEDIWISVNFIIQQKISTECLNAAVCKNVLKSEINR